MFLWLLLTSVTNEMFAKFGSVLVVRGATAATHTARCERCTSEIMPTSTDVAWTWKQDQLASHEGDLTNCEGMETLANAVAARGGGW